MRMLIPTTRDQFFNSDLFNEMDRLFDDAWTSVPRAFYDERKYDPACEITETPEHFMMSIDVPGMKKEDIKIEVSHDVLTVSGERKRERTEKDQKTQRYEKSYGFFKRSFALPNSVQADKVEARYEDGVLELCLPKVEAAKPRQIEINSSKGGVFGKLLGSKKNDKEMKDVSSDKAS